MHTSKKLIERKEYGETLSSLAEKNNIIEKLEANLEMAIISRNE